MLYKYGTRTRNSMARFYSHFNLVFYIVADVFFRMIVLALLDLSCQSKPTRSYLSGHKSIRVRVGIVLNYLSLKSGCHTHRFSCLRTPEKTRICSENMIKRGKFG